MKINTHSYNETVKLGNLFSRYLKSGMCVCIDGEMGSGKTAFVTGIAKGLGYNDDISSPTFTIVNEYDTYPKLLHFDVYRIENVEELFFIGFEDYLCQDAVVIIEWSLKIIEILPTNIVSIQISKDREKYDERVFEFDIKYEEFRESFAKEVGDEYSIY